MGSEPDNQKQEDKLNQPVPEATMDARILLEASPRLKRGSATGTDGMAREAVPASHIMVIYT